MKHEQKNCPRCQAQFECKMGDIANCQCYGIALTPSQEAHIRSRYDDCLCSTCLLHLKQPLHLLKEQQAIKRSS